MCMTIDKTFMWLQKTHGYITIFIPVIDDDPSGNDACCQCEC